MHPLTARGGLWAKMLWWHGPDMTMLCHFWANVTLHGDFKVVIWASLEYWHHEGKEQRAAPTKATCAESSPA